MGVLGALGHDGGGELLRRLKVTSENELTLDVLSRLVHDDKDMEVQLASARALLCITREDPESAKLVLEIHALPLAKALCRHEGGIGEHEELSELLREFLGIQKDVVSDSSDDEQDIGDEHEHRKGEVCVVCCRALHKHGATRVLACGHTFHGDCVKRWFSCSQRCWQKKTCPVCRWEPPRTSRQCAIAHTRRGSRLQEA